jgi:hypothetical protein
MDYSDKKQPRYKYPVGPYPQPQASMVRMVKDEEGGEKVLFLMENGLF